MENENQPIFEALCNELEQLYLCGGIDKAIKETKDSITTLLDFELCKREVLNNPIKSV